MKTRTLGLAIGLSSLALAASSASAAIFTTTGNGLQIPAPTSCVLGALTGGQTAFAWDEQQAFTVSNLFVDMVNNPGSSGSPTPGTISGLVDSHAIHVEDFSGLPPAVGTVVFRDPIVGVAIYNTTLDNTDIYGSGGTTYPTFFPFRDLVINGSSFSINSNVLTFNFTNLSPVLGVMQVRVFTQVPAPGAASLAGLAGIAAIRRTRRHA
jgi:hypothetical protein